MLNVITTHADSITASRNDEGDIRLWIYDGETRVSLAIIPLNPEIKSILAAIYEAAKHPERVNAISDLAVLTCEDCGCGHVEMGGVRPEDGQ